MTAFADILQWSSNRPAWQRDALRRLVTTGKFTEADIDELTAICLAQHSVDDLPHALPTAVPFEEEHLPEPAEATERVRLVSLGEVEGVNALAPGQAMAFQRDGLTIVFGFNGSGKTGYARVLRAMCRARDAGLPVLPNAFGEGDPATPVATVEFEVGSRQLRHRWKQGIPPPPELRRVSFFDSECAIIQVNEANDVAFIPAGLAVLPTLAGACQLIGRNIDERLEAVERSKPRSLWNLSEIAGTEVERLLKGLTATNAEPLIRLSTLSDAEVARLDELRELLRTDILNRLAQIQSRVRAIQRIRRSAEEIARGLSTESLEAIHSRLQDAALKRTAASVAAQAAFGNQPLAGVGEEVWQQLWAAARRYSEHWAYPGIGFPNVGEHSRCVLCQQELDFDARQRFSTFETFLQMDVERSAAVSESTLDASVEPITRFATGVTGYRDVLPVAQIADEQLHRDVRRFYRIARLVQQRVVESCSLHEWHEPVPLPPSPTPQLAALEDRLRERIADLERSRDDQYRRDLELELRSLNARKWLAGIVDDVHFEVTRQGQLAALLAAKRDTVTTGITLQSSELTDRYVTEALQVAMTNELRELGAANVQVTLDSAGGHVGHKRFKVSLRDAADRLPVGRVLSEGEFRCVALAGFLTELSTDESQSAVVLDDPVSSLDHRWRRRVADRLGRLADERQVIVFTHDLQFVSDLLANSDEDRRREVRVYRGVQPGMCLDGLPWESMSVKKRIGYLKQRVQAARVCFRSEGEIAYSSRAREIYGLLRESWERAVEEILLNGVVTRYAASVQTLRLRKLTDISDSDVLAIDEAMTRCSRFFIGHDTPDAGAEPSPGPDELAADVEALESWSAGMRPRR